MKEQEEEIIQVSQRSYSKPSRVREAVERYGYNENYGYGKVVDHLCRLISLFVYLGFSHDQAVSAAVGVVTTSSDVAGVLSDIRDAIDSK